MFNASRVENKLWRIAIVPINNPKNKFQEKTKPLVIVTVLIEQSWIFKVAQQSLQ